ncbi:CotH kinase family protein [Winogradskyella maritima]|uniref:CotH kinase family protein n=1 Tax=Winogradskyella maritima TaxID=1517766 RepID=A0ABV8AKV5_9FLAO|nr:CotH kinase family protein [Winogradskyella maritima]
MFFKNQITVLFAFVILLFFHSTGRAQHITAKKGSFGVDETHKLIVWHHSNLDALNGKKAKTINFNDTFEIADNTTDFSYSTSFKVSKSGEIYDLYITRLPLVHIALDTTVMTKDKKRPGHFTYFNKNTYQESAMGIRIRGNLSLTFPKKSYDIEFRTDTISKISKDLKFEGMRSDDDWILDGLYNEPLKLRSTIATGLWSDIHKPYYQTKEPKAQNGFDVDYVELFRNGEYVGLYALSESVDRKQLKLKKNKGSTVRGELFKANSYDGGPEFKKITKAYDNLFPHFTGFRMEYPIIDYKSYWDDLAQLLDLVINQSDAVFSEQIEEKFNVTNAIDYFIFVNVMRASDNLGKNYYLAKYDTKEPYFFVPWDLDGSFGVILEGRRVPNTKGLLSNGLFDKLMATDTNDYKNKLKTRWASLRQNELSTERLLQLFQTRYQQFTNEKIYERDQRLWPKQTTNEEDWDYLKSWLNERMSILDTEFSNLD